VQRTPRKKILNNLCDLRLLCGEVFLENGIGFHEVSYKNLAPPDLPSLKDNCLNSAGYKSLPKIIKNIKIIILTYS
jgi:hypothetical protein